MRNPLKLVHNYTRTLSTHENTHATFNYIISNSGVMIEDVISLLNISGGESIYKTIFPNI